MAGTATAPRSRAAHLGPERRRPQVLDAARRIAARDGIGGVNIGTVAQEIGVTRPVVYACFSHRTELIEALLQREAEVLSAAVMEALHSSGSADDSESAFVVGFQALLATATTYADTWRILLFGIPDPAMHERFIEVRASVTEASTAWIGPAMKHWWATEQLDRKLPVLIEFFVSSCEAALRSMLAPANDWTADELGAFVGRSVHRAFSGA